MEWSRSIYVVEVWSEIISDDCLLTLLYWCRQGMPPLYSSCCIIDHSVLEEILLFRFDQCDSNLTQQHAMSVLMALFFTLTCIHWYIRVQKQCFIISKVVQWNIDKSQSSKSTFPDTSDSPDVTFFFFSC